MRGFRAVVLAACAANVAIAQTGDTTVRNANTAVHPRAATLVREASFGVVDGAEEYVFGEISEVAIGRDGSIYVYDRQVPALRKYDANGKYVKTFGRKGQGPGEYLNAGGLAVAPDGRVLLWDTGNWRINVYTADGNVLTAIPTVSGASGGGSASISTSRSLMVDTASRVYIRRTFIRRTAQGISRDVVTIRYRMDGTPIDTTPVPTFGAPLTGLTATSPGGNASTSTNVPFAATPRWTMSPLGYLITGVPDRYAFEMHAASGPGVLSVRRSMPPIPVSAHERDSARAAITEQMRKTDPLWTWNGPEIPKNKPYYADIVTGDDGRVWLPVVAEITPRLGMISSPGIGVGRGGPPRPAPQRVENPIKFATAVYDVFEPNGAYLGQVQIPPRVSSAVRRGDYVWGVEFGEDDVQKVVRFRINW